MKEKKECPFVDSEEGVWCSGDVCAWWVQTDIHGMCAVKKVALMVERLAEKGIR